MNLKKTKMLNNIINVIRYVDFILRNLLSKWIEAKNDECWNLENFPVEFSDSFSLQVTTLLYIKFLWNAVKF